MPHYVEVEKNQFGWKSCPTCGARPKTIQTKNNKKYKVFEMKDTLSVDEYIISGMCQDCQDTIFEGE